MVGGDSPLPSDKLRCTENSQDWNLDEMPQTEVEPESDACRLCFCFCNPSEDLETVRRQASGPQAHSFLRATRSTMQVPKPCMHVGAALASSPP